MKSITTILTILFFNICATSQALYSYDASGNRIQRNFLVVKSTTVINEDDTLVQSADEELLLLLQQEKMMDSIADIINAENATLSSETINVSLFPNPTVNTVTITAEVDNGVYTVARVDTPKHFSTTITSLIFESCNK